MSHIKYIEGLHAGLFTPRQRDIAERFAVASAFDTRHYVLNRDYDGLGGTGRIDHELMLDPIDLAKIKRRKANDNLPKPAAA